MGVELLVATTLLSVASAAAGGMAASNAAAYQSKVAQQNAQIAEQKKQMELAAGENQAAKQGMQEHAQAGAIVAAQASRGVDVNSGSALDVQTGQSQVSMMDQLAIRSDMLKRAWGQDIAANSFRNQAQLYGMESDNALIAGGLKAGSAAFQGGSALDQKYGFFN